MSTRVPRYQPPSPVLNTRAGVAHSQLRCLIFHHGNGPRAPSLLVKRRACSLTMRKVPSLIVPSPPQLVAPPVTFLGFKGNHRVQSRPPQHPRGIAPLLPPREPSFPHEVDLQVIQGAIFPDMDVGLLGEETLKHESCEIFGSEGFVASFLASKKKSSRIPPAREFKSAFFSVPPLPRLHVQLPPNFLVLFSGRMSMSNQNRLLLWGEIVIHYLQTAPG